MPIFALLSMLRQAETSARAWIDAFLFRASAMLPPDKRMVVSMEHGIPFTTISPSSLAGFVDYTVVVANRRSAGNPFRLISTAPLNIPSRFLSWRPATR
jgi:hypothetical protein